jgi:hypothetical protein
MKRQAVKQLKMCIRLARKCARQVNRKLATLAELNRQKDQAKKILVTLYEKQK